MASTIVFELADCANLIARGLGAKVRGVTVQRRGEGLRVECRGLDAHRRIPRCDVAFDLTLSVRDGHLMVQFSVAPVTWSAMVLVPGQWLGGGRLVVETIVDRLGLRPAVVNLTDRVVVLDPARIAVFARLGLHIDRAHIDDVPGSALILDVRISGLAPPE